MNVTAQPVPLNQRGRAFVAALIAFVMAVAGVLVATPVAAAETPTATASVSSATDAGLQVEIEFANVPASPLAPPQNAGVYIGVVEAGSNAVLGSGNFVPNAAIVSGAGSSSYTVAASSLDRTRSYEGLVWYAHGNPTEAAIVARTPLTVTSAQWDAVFGSDEDEGGSEDEGSGSDGEGSEGSGSEGSDNEGDSDGESSGGEDGEGDGNGDDGDADGGDTGGEGDTFTPELSASLVDGTPLAAGATVYKGDTVVVRGSGFDPEGNPAVRAPVTVGDPAGNYVVFGNFAEVWRPSVSGTSSGDRAVAVQRWALTDATFENIDARYINAVRGQRVTLNTDGTFEFEIELSGISGAAPAGGSYGVFTYVAGGAPNDTAQELELRLDYIDHERPEAPKLEVFTADGVTPVGDSPLFEGDTVVVRGSGFDPEGNPAVRAPVTVGDPAGNYVVFGNFAEVWRPSVSGTSSGDRAVAVQRWALTDATFENIDARYINAVRGQRVTLNTDGTFEFEIELSGISGAAPAGGSYGVFTYVAGGAPNDTAQELEVRLNYQGKAPAVPAIEVSLAEVSAEDGATVRVVGSDFGAVTGAYAAIIEKGKESEVTGSGGYVAFGFWMTPGAIVSGAFDKTLVAETGGLDPAKQYEVIVWQGHSNPNADTIYARADVPFTASDWETLFPDTTPSPVLTVTPATGLDPEGETVTVTGSGYDPAQPIYVFLCEDVELPANLWEHALNCRNGAAVVNAEGAGRGTEFAADGSFTLEFSVKQLDGATAVFTAANHTAPNDRGQDAKAVLEFAEPAPVVPVLAVTPATGLDPEGETVTVTGSGYDPAQPIYVFLCEDIELPANLWEHALNCRNGAAVVYQHGAVDRAGAPQPNQFTADGSFEIAFLVKELDAEATAVFTAANHTAPNDRGQDAKAVLAFAAAPAGPSVEVGVTSASAEDGAAIRVVGSGFDGITGAYAAIIEKGTEAGVGADGGYVAFGYWMVPGIFVGGGFDRTLIAPTANLDPEKEYEFLVWEGHTAPGEDTIYARADVPFTASDWELLFPGTTPEPKPEEPTTPTTPTVPGGSLRWAISSSFSSYVTGPIANGEISVSGGATRSGGQFQFGQAAGSTFNPATGLGSVSYVGAVRFTGHHGVLDVTVRNPQIVITSGSSATLYVTSGGSRVALATLNLAAGVKTTNNGAVTFTAVPAALTSAGQSQVFGGNYTALNPVTFTIGSPAPAPAGSAGTVAGAAQQPEKKEIPATPPATTGVEVADDDLAAFAAGGAATFTASGFQPNEQDIQVVVYSTPVLLDTVTADAAGVATWTGSVPATLPDGEHTLTFQGSVDRGLVFALDRGAALTAFGQCIAEDATLNWGFKESFRVYIEGIAHGGWDLTDLEYRFPDYVWTGGAGTLDADSLTGLIAYGGTIAFHGHDGALDTKLSNARIELAGDKGYLVFDISGTTQGGDDVDVKDVRFAEFSLDGVELTDGAITIDAAAATLTEAGADAFGTYPAGEELDPVSAVIPVDAECGVIAEEPVVTEPGPVAEPEDTDAAGDPVWPWIAGGALLVLLLGVGIGVIAARGRKNAASANISE